MSRFQISILALLIVLTVSSCKVGRFIIYNFADIGDHKIFPSREFQNDSIQFVFPQAKVEKSSKSVQIEGVEVSFEEFLLENKTVAFLVIKNDTILYEHYFDGYSESSIVPSFSMAKSFISILVGCAIDDGLIESVHEPITNYIPELKEKGFEKVTIEHVLQMTSGMDYNEGYYNPSGKWPVSIMEGTLEIPLQNLI